MWVETAVMDTKPDIGEVDFDKLVEQLSTSVTSSVIGVTTSELDSLLTIEGRAVIRKSGSGSGAGTPATLDSESTTKIDDVEIEALEGDKSYLRPNGELYYARKWGEHSDIEVLRKAREAGQYVMLYGVPGTGKTALVEASFPDEVYTILGSGDTEVADLVGSYVQTPSGDFEWIDGALVKSAEEGKVLFIDEVGLIDPKVMAVVYGLMDGRKELVVTSNPERGVVKAKEGFWVVSATNPNVAGVRLSEALLSRFTIQVEMTTDWALAKALEVPKLAVVASQNLATKQEAGETSWSPQMRELLAFRDLAKLFGTEWAIRNLIASSPEIDRPLVSDVFTRVFGKQVLPAKI